MQDLGFQDVPAPSTITEILHRHRLIDPEQSSKHRPPQRFEYPEPNALWQMDFKGHFALDRGRCHALTILDDHSRYALGLDACRDERTATVQQRLIRAFRRYGLPRRMLMDNGPPWGDDGTHPYAPLTVWLLRLGIAVSHGRPYHPQTQGKDERFHRTLKAEVLARQCLHDLRECQRHFDAWRELYNHERPHEALNLDVPASRYRISPRVFPSYQGRDYRLPKAFNGYALGLRATSEDGIAHILFAHAHILTLNLKA